MENKIKIAIGIILFLILLSLLPTERSYASGNYITRNDGFYPPRIHQICNDNFIGMDWEVSKKYEKRCRTLWTLWTGEIKKSFSAN